MIPQRQRKIEQKMRYDDHTIPVCFERREGGKEERKGKKGKQRYTYTGLLV